MISVGILLSKAWLKSASVSIYNIVLSSYIKVNAVCTINERPVLLIGKEKGVADSSFHIPQPRSSIDIDSFCIEPYQRDGGSKHQSAEFT